MSAKRIFFVIPAFNEGRKIADVVRSLQRAGYNNIVVIDDGSKDNTYEAALRTGVHTLRHVINRGQGASLKTGIDYALLQGAEFIVTFDSDGQHRVEDLPAMLKPVLNNEVDVTLGSRFKRKTDIPFNRKMLLKGAILVQWLFYGVLLSDVHNGFRVFNRKASQKIKIQCDRMEHASEIVEEVHRNKLRFREVPIVIKYTAYSQRKGHASWIGAVRILWKMVVKKMIG
jgi:glycosyltransferase involved in cell wall biosynthesis